MTKTYERWQRKNLETALSSRRVVMLVGPRQCGKTTLARQVVSKNSLYLTLDDPTLLTAAKLDPVGFVRNPGRLTIIDEIQRAPELLSAIKMVVDEDNRPGQFLLTGSANIQALPTVRESLAGRVSKLRLRPLVQGEIQGTTPNFLDRLVSENFQTIKYKSNKEVVLDLIFKGGFPEALTLSEGGRGKWYADYISSLIDRDLRDIAHIQQTNTLKQLIHVVNSWSSKILDMTSISGNLSISRTTTESYLNALELMYLVERVQPWTNSDYARLGRRPKIFSTDTGLMCSILNASKSSIVFDADRLGKSFETFVFQELSALIDVNSDYNLYHYRDREDHEIDFIIEGKDDQVLAIEAKASMSISPSDFNHIRWFRDRFAKDRPFRGVVIYSGENLVSLGDNLWAIPISALWEG